MPLILVDRNLAAAFLALLVITGAVLFTGSSARGNAFSAGPHACAAEPPDPHENQSNGAAAANGTRPSAAGEHRLDDARVIAALRQVIQDHDAATLLHYPCGDMAWAGPIVMALQVRRGLRQGSGLLVWSPMQRIAHRALLDARPAQLTYGSASGWVCTVGDAALAAAAVSPASAAAILSRVPDVSIRTSVWFTLTCATPEPHRLRSNCLSPSVLCTPQNGSSTAPAYLGADADGAAVDANIMRFGREKWHFRRAAQLRTATLRDGASHAAVSELHTGCCRANMSGPVANLLRMGPGSSERVAGRRYVRRATRPHGLPSRAAARDGPCAKHRVMRICVQVGRPRPAAGMPSRPPSTCCSSGGPSATAPRRP